MSMPTANGNEENTIADPRHVYPAHGSIRTRAPGEILFDVPAYSLSILRIPLK